MKKVQLSLIQMKGYASDLKARAHAVAALNRACDRGTQIVAFQELFLGPYFCTSETRAPFRLAERIPGPTTDFFSKLARKRKVVLIVPVFEKYGKKLYYNSAVVIDANGELLGTYRKSHIPEDPYFYEKFYFTPGDRGYPVFQTRFAKIGVLICWDQWFPEAARIMALKGAQILFYPSAIGWVPGEKPKTRVLQKKSWETVQVSHAVTNGIYVAVINRVGREGPIVFWGNSFVAAPSGEILRRARKAETVLHATCDLSQITEARKNWPFMRDRRIDTYQVLSKRNLS